MLFGLPAIYRELLFQPEKSSWEIRKKQNRRWRITLISIKGTKSLMVTLLPGYQCWRITDQQSGVEWLTLQLVQRGSHGIEVCDIKNEQRHRRRKSAICCVWISCIQHFEMTIRIVSPECLLFFFNFEDTETKSMFTLFLPHPETNNNLFSHNLSFLYLDACPKGKSWGCSLTNPYIKIPTNLFRTCVGLTKTSRLF